MVDSTSPPGYSGICLAGLRQCFASYVYALALDRVGQRAKALAVLAKAQGRFPGDRDILTALVSSSLEAGDQQGAARWAQKVQALGSGQGERR